MPNSAALDRVIDMCYETQIEFLGQDLISLEGFIAWVTREPDCLVWLPVLHRVAATNASKHESKCEGCRMFPIVGFCYSAEGMDLCQYCFWSHEHLADRAEYADDEFTEYCFQRNSSMQTKRLLSSVARKFTTVRKTKKKSKQRKGADDGRTPTTRRGRGAKGVGGAHRDNQPGVISDPPTQSAFGGRLVQGVSAGRGSEPRVAHAGHAPNTPRDSAAHQPSQMLQGGARADVNALLAEDHRLIQEACAEVAPPPRASMGGGGVSGATARGGLFSMAQGLDNEQKRYLLRVIDELDADNRSLVQQLMQTRDEMMFAVDMAKRAGATGSGTRTVVDECSVGDALC